MRAAINFSVVEKEGVSQTEGKKTTHKMKDIWTEETNTEKRQRMTRGKKRERDALCSAVFYWTTTIVVLLQLDRL